MAVENAKARVVSLFTQQAGLKADLSKAQSTLTVDAADAETKKQAVGFGDYFHWGKTDAETARDDAAAKVARDQAEVQRLAKELADVTKEFRLAGVEASGDAKLAALPAQLESLQTLKGTLASIRSSAQAAASRSSVGQQLSQNAVVAGTQGRMAAVGAISNMSAASAHFAAGNSQEEAKRGAATYNSFAKLNPLAKDLLFSDPDSYAAVSAEVAGLQVALDAIVKRAQAELDAGAEKAAHDAGAP